MIEPRKNARAPVIEVTVMEGPACAKPIRNLVFASNYGLVMSMLLTITNISSTPMPRIMNGRIWWKIANFYPSKKATE